MARYAAVLFRKSDRPALFAAYGALRRRLFVEHLGWDLDVRDGLELDGFDHETTLYAALLRDEVLVGGFRVLPTDGPYLGAVAFPQLAALRSYPRRADCHEVTRFGVDPEAADPKDGLRLYALMFRFAQLHGSRSLVAVCDETYERFLRGMGVRTLRYGPPVTVAQDRFGRPVVALAGEIPIALQNGSRFTRLLAHADDMEIHDETSVLGRARLSA